MKKRAIILIVVSLVALIIILFLLNFNGNDSDKTSSESIIDTGYIVKYHNKQVCLIKNNSVIERFEDVNIELLPTEDRLLLEEGIIVSSVAEAHSLIEDYDG